MPEEALASSAVYTATPTVRVDSQDSPKANQLLIGMEMTEAEGGLTSLANIMDPKWIDRQSMVDKLMGGMDVTINNAGISLRHDFMDITPEEWRKVMSVDLDGVFYVAQQSAKRMLAGTGGAIAAMIYMMVRFGKPDPSMMANGMLAGLVAITAPCAFVTSASSMLIGAVAGILVCLSVFFIEGTLKVDDPVGAISVHGVNGAWGVLSLGLLADGKYGDGWNGVPGTVTGLFYGNASQFFAQCIGTLTCAVFVFVSFYVFFKVLDAIIGNRVSAEVEIGGLDMPEMGALAYPEFVTTSASTYSVGALPAASAAGATVTAKQAEAL
jgi:hypothetical protein